MNRKNTILIAVLINAGLLSVLLIAALTTQEEVMPSPALIGDASSHFSKLEENPLFGDSIDLAMRKSSETMADSPIAIPLPELSKSEITPHISQLMIPAAASTPLTAKEEAPLIHKLPTLVPESNLSAAAPVSPSPAVPANPVAAGNRIAPTFTEVAVKKGDNLEKIAKNNHTTVDEIIKINQLPSSFLRVGQMLKIPAAASGTVSVATTKSTPAEAAKAAKTRTNESAAPEYYTVKVGDNPWTIAMKHHMKVEELLRLNALNEEKARKLKPGDRLRTR